MWWTNVFLFVNQIEFLFRKVTENLSKIKTFRSMNAGSVSSDIDRSITNFERKRKEKMRCTRPEQLIAERRQLGEGGGLIDLLLRLIPMLGGGGVDRNASAFDASCGLISSLGHCDSVSIFFLFSYDVVPWLVRFIFPSFHNQRIDRCRIFPVFRNAWKGDVVFANSNTTE